MRHVPTGALALLLAAPLVASPNLNPAVTLSLGAALGGALCILAIFMGSGTLRRSIAVTFACGMVFSAWLAIAAGLSANPSVSLLGTVAQHTGAALWPLAGAWALACALLAERRTLRGLLAVTAIAGAVYAAMGVAEALTSGDRSWGSAAGPFENSASLGSFLAVALFAAAGWWLSSRAVAIRVAAGLSAIVCAAGIAASESRGGMAGLAAGLLVVLVLARGLRWRLTRSVVAVALPAIGVATTGMLLAAASGRLGDTARGFIAASGTSRDAIWRSALAQFRQSPLFGSGPEQFSAWVSWSFRQGLLEYSGTYDPHNMVVGIALGGGIVALALWAILSGSVVVSQVGVLERTGTPAVLLPVAAIPAALAASALFAWLTPSALIAASALTGALFAADSVPRVLEHAHWKGRPVNAIAWVLGIACVVTAVGSVPMMSAEWRFDALGRTASAESYSALYGAWPDPAYATAALDAAFAQGADSETVNAALNVPAERVAEHVDLALRGMFLAQEALTGGADAWERFAAAVDVGRHADPASAIWYTVAAAQADALQMPLERAKYARLALTLDPPPEERAYLESLLTAE